MVATPVVTGAAAPFTASATRSGPASRPFDSGTSGPSRLGVWLRPVTVCKSARSA